MNSPAVEEYYRRQLLLQDFGFWLLIVLGLIWTIDAYRARVRQR